jgi:hypothetical protein
MTEKLATKAHEPTRPDREARADEAVAARLEAARRTVQAAPATPAPAISRWSSWYNR